MRLGGAQLELGVVQRAGGEFAQLAQLAVQAVGLRHFERDAGQTQPGQQALDPRQLFGEVFRLAFVARQG